MNTVNTSEHDISEDPVIRAEFARILRVVAEQGLNQPRDLDVAIDAMLTFVRDHMEKRDV
jgi:hypothetical protein